MEYTVEILRGWPADGSRERVETIKSGSTLNNGDVVEKQSDGTVDKVSATKNRYVGLVVRGNGDSSSGSNTGKAVVIWGNCIARISNYAAGSYTPGAALTAVSGQFSLASGTDPVVGYVLDVVATSSTATANIVAVLY